MGKFKSLITIRDEKTHSTIVEGEECEFVHIRIRNDRAFALVVNSQEHEMFVPYQVFLNHFKDVPEETEE